MNLFSVNGFGKSMNCRVIPSQCVVYNEEAFRYLLQGEAKRSERSGYFSQVLLVYRINMQGVIVPMDSEVAGTVISALATSLRETDYIGWYRKDYVIGGVLTVVERDALVDASNRLRPCLLETFRAGLGSGDVDSVQLRVFQQHELKRAELGEESFVFQ